MIILKSSYNSFFKIVVVISCFSLPQLCLSEEVVDDQIVETQGNINENSLYTQKRTEKSKENFERLLLGTWRLSHNDRGTKFSTRMELTEYFVDDGYVGVKGLVFRGLKLLGEEVFCTKVVDVAIRNKMNIDYLCFNKDVDGIADLFINEPTYLMGFKVLGDKITNGIIGIGKNLSKAEENFYSDNFPLTGFREVIVENPPKDIFSRIDALFDQYESTYREFFPERTLSHQQSFKIAGYYARYYPERNLYIGTKDGSVFSYSTTAPAAGIKKTGNLEEQLKRYSL